MGRLIVYMQIILWMPWTGICQWEGTVDKSSFGSSVNAFEIYEKIHDRPPTSWSDISGILKPGAIEKRRKRYSFVNPPIELGDEMLFFMRRHPVISNGIQVWPLCLASGGTHRAAWLSETEVREAFRNAGLNLEDVLRDDSAPKLPTDQSTSGSQPPGTGSATAVPDSRPPSSGTGFLRPLLIAVLLGVSLLSAIIVFAWLRGERNGRE